MSTLSPSRRRHRRNAALAVAAAALLALALAFVVFGHDTVLAQPTRHWCAVAEGSGSTYDQQIRTNYLTAFDRDVRWFAGQPGDAPMCLIIATGTPTNNPIGTAPIHATDPNSTSADAEVEANVGTAEGQFSQVLASATDNLGTPLVEALYALALSGQVADGDTISVYSDMRQNSDNVRITDFVGSNRPTDLNAALEAALDRLAAAQILPDGQNGRPSMRGVRIAVPAPAASIAASGDPKAQAERAATTHAFWMAWARRTGAILLWGQGAGA
jgi:hypothetical protein